MGSLSQAKTLGGIGSILTLLLLAPYYSGTVLVIIGWILILLATKRISDAVQDKSIYNNVLVAVILQVVGNIVFAIVIASAFLRFIGLGNLTSSGTPIASGDIAGVIAAILVGLAIVWIIGLVSSFMLWRGFKTIGTRLSMGLFGTAGLLFFIGSILTIIIIGFLLLFIAQILFVAAFFSLPDNPPGTTQPQPMGGPSAPSA